MEFAGIAPPRMGLHEDSMPFATRSFRRFPVHFAVTYNAGPFVKLPLGCFLGFCLLITLLVLSCGQACAEWVPVANNDERGVTTYVDPDTISHKGYLVKVWTLFNWKTVQTEASDSYLSSKEQIQLDCAEERVRLLAFTLFSGNMGSGNVVKADSYETKWELIQPRSINRVIWVFVCVKK
jgi:hypothetical protein